MAYFNKLNHSVFRKVPDCKQDVETIGKENTESDKTLHNRRVYYKRYFVRLAGIIGALAVALGGYGNYVLHRRSDIPDARKKIFDTGNFYHFIHTLPLLLVPFTNKPMLAGVFIMLGIILFCGSCYITGVSGNSLVAAVTPFGGISFIVGWTCMIL